MTLPTPFLELEVRLAATAGLGRAVTELTVAGRQLQALGRLDLAGETRELCRRAETLARELAAATPAPIPGTPATEAAA